MPGTAVATTSSVPVETSRLETPAQAVIVEVLEQGVVGRQRPGPNLGRPGPAAPGPGAPTPGRRGARAGRTGRARPLLPSTSTISVVVPGPGRQAASAAVTVVLPTPPLPATMVTRAGGTNGAGSTCLPVAATRSG